MTINERVFRASQAHKLEDPQRKVWLPPDEVVLLLGVRPGMTVADVGAGTGYFTLPIAQMDPPVEKIFAVDVQPEMLELLRAKLVPALRERVSLVEGTAEDNHLNAGSCDLVLLANVWHELDDRRQVLAECRRILRANGRVGVLDWRADVEPEPGPPMGHRIAREAAAAELAGAGWAIELNRNVGMFSYLLVASV